MSESARELVVPNVENIRKFRKLKGYSQVQLAYSIDGLSTDYLRKIEQGRQRRVGLSIVESLAEKLGVTLDVLILSDPALSAYPDDVCDDTSESMEMTIDEAMEVGYQLGYEAALRMWHANVSQTLSSIERELAKLERNKLPPSS